MLDGITATIENRTFDELAVGDTASMSHTVTQRDIDLFAVSTGDTNPMHLDAEFAEAGMFGGVITHGMWGAGLISAVLGTQLPGPGTVYLGQELRFQRPVSVGDTLTATLTVRGKDAAKGDVTLDCVCTNQHGKAVITGVAEARAPVVKVRRAQVALPTVRVSRHAGTRAVLAQAACGEAVATAVVHPTVAGILRAALDAAAAGLIVPVLVGPVAHIRTMAEAAGLDLAGIRLVDAADGPTAATQAVAMALAGEVGLLMKGVLHTDELMHAVVATQGGLRTDRRISHAYLLDVPEYPRPLLLTDVAINVTPTLAHKADIVQNAIGLAHLIGIPQPRVAILAAVETVSDRLPPTLDAAALCKMAERGQITGGLLDGPLSLDCAVSEAAAAAKGIVSPVAGRADILVVPDLQAGNMLAKSLTFLAGAEAAGVVLGARVPVILASRADSANTVMASCALGVLASRVHRGASA